MVHRDRSFEKLKPFGSQADAAQRMPPEIPPSPNDHPKLLPFRTSLKDPLKIFVIPNRSERPVRNLLFPANLQRLNRV